METCLVIFRVSGRWTGMIRVDGNPYLWMGFPPSRPASVNQTSFEYTSTKSIFTMDVGGSVEMVITFLSPLTPDDQKRQSLLFSYLDVAIKSLDGEGHQVELYADITAEWVAGNVTAKAQWDYDVVDDIAYHKVYKQEQEQFAQTGDKADWGYWYWATDNAVNLTYQSGNAVALRSAFQTVGKLSDSSDTNYRPIGQDWPTFGFAVNIGTVQGDSVSTLFTIGLAQDDAVQFDGADGIVSVPSLWTSYFSKDTDADWSTALDVATQFDNKVGNDSQAAGDDNYLTITSLSARQAFGALQLTGTEEKPYIFVKEISSDGNIQTVDVIFPFIPILLYTNASLVKFLLDPLFENQEAGNYPNKYSMHDLGASYPNATGHPLGNDEEMPLEECGNMLIMTLAYAKRTNNISYLTQHYTILNQWTQYLIESALIPADQLSTDDFAGHLANQTNLALKGIIGIEAMSQIALLTNNSGDSQNYTTISHSYISQWQNLSIVQSPGLPHTTLSYGSPDTHGLLYNLYADKLLNLNLIPQSLYDMQDAFYPTAVETYGIPLDTRHTYTKSDWQMFVAAISSNDTKNMFIDKMATWIGETNTTAPLTDFYDTESGGFVARPVVGGHFALLALQNTAGSDAASSSLSIAATSSRASSATASGTNAPDSETTKSAAGNTSTAGSCRGDLYLLFLLFFMANVAIIFF
ncbi:hypothetical protein B7494_g3561 [Chlorociboria aeruginascens]|nr:hypothetical protein B7494_g3561 [Chlorociboria aeruginascens]